MNDNIIIAVIGLITQITITLGALAAMWIKQKAERAVTNSKLTAVETAVSGDIAATTEAIASIQEVGEKQVNMHVAINGRMEELNREREEKAYQRGLAFSMETTREEMRREMTAAMESIAQAAAIAAIKLQETAAEVAKAIITTARDVQEDSTSKAVAEAPKPVSGAAKSKPKRGHRLKESRSEERPPA